MNNQSIKYVFKYIIIGDPSVGKSCLLERFLHDKFTGEYNLTVGVEFGAKKIQLNNEQIKLQIWDTAGQENFKSITRGYYRSAAVAIIVYDISDRQTFNNISSWLRECKMNGNQQMTLILVGNKCDLEEQRQITKEEAEQFSKDNNLIFYETSAKFSNNVFEMFQTSAQEVNKKIKSNIIDPRNEIYGVKLGKYYNKGILNNNDLRKKKDNKCCQLN